MKKNIIYNKYYRNLRENIFSNLEIKEFMQVYAKFKRLKMQYKFLKIAEFLEKLHIHNFETPIIGFFIRLLNFMRWKLYDLLMILINGRIFNLYGVTIFCGRQR